MCPPAGAPLAEIHFHCSDEALFISLEGITTGSALPANVIADINPYQYAPENLPEGIWYLVRSGENTATEHGDWIPQGQPVRVFSTSSVSGWKTTLRFCEKQASQARKTDWVMQEYKITGNGLRDNFREPNALCRVIRDGVLQANLKMHAPIDTSNFSPGNCGQSTLSLVANSSHNTGQGSTSNHLAVATDDPPNHPVENLEANDDGDFLELRDLEDRQSASFSSENSSCMTMSSNECFDSLALLQDLECEQSKDLEQKDSHCKFSKTSFEPDCVVRHDVRLGSYTSHEPEKFQTESIHHATGPQRTSALPIEEVNVRDSVVGNGDNHCANEQASSSRNPLALQGRKKSDKKSKMLKKWCLMPFQFMF